MSNGTSHLSSSFFEPSRWMPFGILLALIALPVVLWLKIHGSPFAYSEPSVPAGQALYALSKLVALLAIVILGIQVVLGLLRKRGARSPMTQAAIHYHKYFGILVTVLVISHVLLFVAAVSLRSGHLAFAVLVPKPLLGFYELGLSLGILGLVLILTMAASGGLMRGRKSLMRILHKLYLPTFLLVILHGWCIGSEGRLTTIVVTVGLLLFGVLALMIKPGKLSGTKQRWLHTRLQRDRS